MTPANQAIEEIKEIVKKYDLAAMVAVSSPDEIAYLKAISPSWSCAWVEPVPGGGVAIRVKAKLADFPSRDAQKKTVEVTVGMFMGFQNFLEATAFEMSQIVTLLSRHYPDITHWERHNPPEGGE
jgi:hypothetical protein